MPTELSSWLPHQPRCPPAILDVRGMLVRWGQVLVRRDTSMGNQDHVGGVHIFVTVNGHNASVLVRDLE
jgi:hypothetical protein